MCSAESCHCERQARSTAASGNASGLVRAHRLHARLAISSSAQKPSHPAVNYTQRWVSSADENAEEIKHDLRRHATHCPADKAACCCLTDGLLVKELARPPVLDDHVLNQQRELGRVRPDGDRLQHVQVVLPCPRVCWREGGTSLACEVVAAAVISVRLRPRATAPQVALHHCRPVGMGEPEASHRAERHLIDDDGP